MVKLAIPMVAGQAMQVGLHAIDAAMVAGLGVEPLAQAAMGNSAAALFYFIGVGLGSTVPVLAARAFGAGDFGRLNLVLRHGLTVSAIYGMTSLAVFAVLAGRILPWFGPPELAQGAKAYALLLVASLLPALALQNLRGFAEAQNRPWLPLVNIGVGVVLNVTLNYGFIYGSWGFPALGLTGAALGTLLARGGMLLHFIWVLRRERAITPAPGAWRWVAPRAGFYGEYFRIGLPSALIAVVLIGNMVVVTGMMGIFGAAELAANETTRQLVMVALTLPMALSWAIAIRVGQAAGRRGSGRLENAAQAALWLSFSCAVSAGLAMFLGRAGWVEIFLGARSAAPRDVVMMAEAMVAVAAAGVMADGVALGVIGIFRGMAAAAVPAAVYATGLWLVGLPLGFFWGHVRGGGGQWVWTGLVAGNVIAAVVLTGLLAWRLRRAESSARA